MVDPERDPFKSYILIIMLVVPIMMLFAFNASASATLKGFPGWSGRALLGMLAVTAGISLWGVIRNQTVLGVLYERAGMMGMAPLFLTYGCWAIGLFGWQSLGFSSFLIGGGVAAIVRVRQINRRRKGVDTGGPFRLGDMERDRDSTGGAGGAADQGQAGSTEGQG